MIRKLTIACCSTCNLYYSLFDAESLNMNESGKQEELSVTDSGNYKML